MVVNTNSGSETASRDVLYFTDSTVTYNDTVYYYIKNLQGDITHIIDSAGTVVVSYVYDAWGGVVSTSGTMADTLGTLNPLRYRGYVYDSESGLYYLQSRYYDPEMGRFLNHDVVFDTDAGMQGYNLFVYCGNNPITRIDISGADSERLDDLDLDDDQVSERGGGGSGSNRGHNRGSGNSNGNNNGGNHAGGSSGGGQKTVYRYGGTNPSNLTPKAKDKGSGLSFSTIPKNGSAVTTIDAINSSGYLTAVQDSATHVTVTPIGGTMSDWIEMGPSSIWTQILKSLVSKY